MDASCLLCGANRNKAGELVAGFGDWSLLLHPDSAVRGHAMLVAARHVENLADMTDSEIHQLGRVQKVCERALLDVTHTDRAILLKLGIQVPHFHLHIYPLTRTMTRDDVMRVINAEVSEVREVGFAKAVRERIERLT